MILSNTDFNVIYVDPSASSAGDGSAPGTPLKALPANTSDVPDGTCYLIRRTAASKEVVLPQGTNSSVASLAIIGMPRAGDALYDMLPTSVKFAWGGDVADYANVKAVTGSDPWGEQNSGMNLPNCQTLILHRINLYRDAQGAYEAAIRAEDNSRTASVSVENCRFGLKGFNLENSSFTTRPSHGAAMYLKFGKPLVLSIRHCIVTMVPDSQSFHESSSWAICATGADFLTLSDIDVWCTTQEYGSGYDYGYGGGDQALKFGSNSSYSSEYTAYCWNANCENLRFHYVRDGAYGYMPAMLYVYGHDFTCLRNVAISMEARQLGSGTPAVVAPGGILVECMNAGEYIYGNIAATLPQVWKIDGNSGIFRLGGAVASSVPGCAKKVEDISVTLGTDLGVDTQDHGNYYANFSSSDTGYWQNGAALQLSFGSDNGPGEGGSSGCEPMVVRNISVVHPRGVALYARNCYVRNCTLNGMLRAVASTCDIASLETWYPGHAIGAASGSTVRVGTLTLGKGNIDGKDGDPAILGNPTEWECHIYVGSSNGQLLSDTRSTSTGYDNGYAVACGSEIDAGHYTMRTENAVCTTWGVARSGGTVPASLKLYNSTADGKGYLSLGRQPFGGFRVAATAGMKMLKLHIAAKGLGDMTELDRRVLVQITVPQPDGSAETVFSSTSGRWTPVSVTWIGESGLSPYRLDVPLEIPGDCTVDVKIHYKWHSPSGYIYIDPGMTIS